MGPSPTKSTPELATGNSQLMSRFHKVKIKRIQRETPDCVTLALDVPTELHDTFKFTQGQYLTFRREHNGEELRRSYSICSSPWMGSGKWLLRRCQMGGFRRWR
ncbi:FAD-binding oxidoreductase [Hymenobacter volaticus]|uniref:FAD-binding oxidoreductase n=1 Tax=Hymenobacter volaticus TaxID=2932254 RepID=A0ABY4G9C7_9BACT|nr:FAD-binding oxidoreductase [Hymenobacter volaticus]UOQ67189.1 FAD-binding oxidoreductase [Hymenobacter volaticus]